MIIRAADERKLSELTRWEEFSNSTDADDAVAFDTSLVPHLAI